MQSAQSRVFAIGLQPVGKAADGARFDKKPRLPVFDNTGAACGARGNNGQMTRHRFQCHVAEGFGDRRIEEHVRRGKRTRQISARLEPDKFRIWQARRKPRARWPFADDNNPVRHIATVELVDGVGKNIQTFFHHQPSEKGNDQHIIGYIQVASPFQIAGAWRKYVAFDPSRPDVDVIIHPLFAQYLRKAFGRGNQTIAPAV